MQNEEINVDKNTVEQIFNVLGKLFKKDDLSVLCETRWKNQTPKAHAATSPCILSVECNNIQKMYITQ